MSTIIMAAVWPLQGMSPSQKAVLISLADQANDDGVCWPAVGTIAARTCLSERAVRDALAWLQASGAVFREYRHNTSTSYTVYPKRFDPSKAPAESKRATKRKTQVAANAAPPAVAATGADAAPPANAAVPPADAAPPPANAAPPEGQMPPPNRKGNRKGTVNEPFPPASLGGADGEQLNREEEFKALCRDTWTAYSAAYEHRYKTEPVRNAKVNTAITQLVKRIGKEAPMVAAWFVANVSEPFVTKRCHDVGDLLSSCEAYRTQWASGLTQQAQPTQPNKQEALEQRNRRVGQAWAAQGGGHAAA